MTGSVFIIEDERSIADAVTYALRSEGFTPEWHETAGAALSALGRSDPRCIVLDVGLPDMSGFELCKRIRERSAVPILFLTARAEEIDRVLGFEIGGDDYVTKPFSPRELVSRIKAILRRAEGAAAERDPKRKAKHFSVDGESLVISFKGKALELSRYEFRLLSVLIRRPGRVYSREELMNLAWETPEMSLERTVDTHIKTIRSKLRAVDASDDSILTHRGFGYSMREDG